MPVIMPGVAQPLVDDSDAASRPSEGPLRQGRDSPRPRWRRAYQSGCGGRSRGRVVEHLLHFIAECCRSGIAMPTVGAGTHRRILVVFSLTTKAVIIARTSINHLVEDERPAAARFFIDIGKVRVAVSQSPGLMGWW